MKILFHDDPFNKDMLTKFFEAVNSSDEIISIYLCSTGGHVSVMECMLHIINSDPKRFNIVGYSELSSCGFEFYLKATCKKEILNGTIGMFHQSTSDITLNDKLKPAYYFDKAVSDRKKNIFWPSLMDFMAKCEFTIKEIKKIKRGDDVYFQYDRFKEIEQAYTKNTLL